MEQAISDIQGQLDAQADAQAREDIVNSSGILTNVQIRQAFAGSVIVGDSITQAISEYGYLDTDVVVSKRGLSVVNAQEQFSTAISLNPSHVFLAFGTNDLEIYNGDPTGFIDAYREKVQMVKDALPDVPIYINSILPIQDFAIASNPALGYYSQFNQALSDFCDEMDCTFIDNTFLVEDSSMYEPDGEHVIMDYYPKWLTSYGRNGRSYMKNKKSLIIKSTMVILLAIYLILLYRADYAKGCFHGYHCQVHGKI